MGATKSRSYVLISPARNEEAHIEKTIQSVISQSILPKKWVIVSDSSTDRTDEIVSHYAMQYAFIELVRVEKRVVEGFASKVKAFERGYQHLKDVEYEYIGNLDADLGFGENYYETMLQKFEANPKLGITGGICFAVHGARHVLESKGRWSIGGGLQLFRRACYEDIGGYRVIERIEDTVAEVMARMKGWEVQSVPYAKVFHYKPTGGSTGNVLRVRFRYGVLEYSIGYHPVYEVVKFLQRLIIEKPYVISSSLRLSGYFWALFRREQKVVPDEFVKYFRREQLQRLKSHLKLR